MYLIGIQSVSEYVVGKEQELGYPGGMSIAKELENLK